MPCLPFNSPCALCFAWLSTFLCSAVIALLGICVSHRTVITEVKHKQEELATSQHFLAWVSSVALRCHVSQLHSVDDFPDPPSDTGVQAIAVCERSSMNGFLNQSYQHTLFGACCLQENMPCNLHCFMELGKRYFHFHIIYVVGWASPEKLNLLKLCKYWWILLIVGLAGVMDLTSGPANVYVPLAMCPSVPPSTHHPWSPHNWDPSEQEFSLIHLRIPSSSSRDLCHGGPTLPGWWGKCCFLLATAVCTGDRMLQTRPICRVGCCRGTL